MITWKEFKESVESQGVTDKTQISWIDCGDWIPDVDFEKQDNPDVPQVVHIS